MNETAEPPPARTTKWVTPQSRRFTALPWVLLLAVGVCGTGVIVSQDRLQDATIELWRILATGDQDEIRAYLTSFGAWGPAVSIALMTLQVILAPIPAPMLQLANGVVFGAVPGAILNLIGQLIGATVAFTISRALGRSAMERLAGKVDECGVVEGWLERWGGKALFLVRVVPGMPSDFVSYLMGLTRMPFRTYFLVSLAGYIPQSLAYAWLGDVAISSFWWIVLAGFGFSGVLGMLIWGIRRSQTQLVPVDLKTDSWSDSS